MGVYLLVPMVGDLTEESLAHSVAREVEPEGDHDRASCQKRGRQRYVCRVPRGSERRAATYRVRMTDRRCWTARRAPGGSGRRAREGCVGLRDQLRLEQLEEIL